MKIIDNSTLQVADSHGTHSRLDTRTLRHAALVNREGSCRLSSAEMVASSSGWGIGWMGGRQDWADHSTISQSLVKAWKAGVRDVGDCMVHSPHPFLVPWGLQ
jgi:hypothetical protein